jgi:hypothetical protein
LRQERCAPNEINFVLFVAIIDLQYDLLSLFVIKVPSSTYRSVKRSITAVVLGLNESFVIRFSATSVGKMSHATVECPEFYPVACSFFVIASSSKSQSSGSRTVGCCTLWSILFQVLILVLPRLCNDNANAKRRRFLPTSYFLGGEPRLIFDIVDLDIHR